MKYTGMLNCLVTVVKHEGVLALYKGTTPTLLKVCTPDILRFIRDDTVISLWRIEPCARYNVELLNMYATCFVLLP